MNDDGPAPTLVVGYDGSDPSRLALEYAQRRAGDGGKVFVVHAFGPPPEWMGAPQYQEILEHHQQRGLGLQREIEERGLEFELVGGDPAEAVARVAKARGADEVIVGTRGFGRLRAALGSTSHSLLHSAPCPVVVVPSRE